jgi:hypothetical protein
MSVAEKEVSYSDLKTLGILYLPGSGSRSVFLRMDMDPYKTIVDPKHCIYVHLVCDVLSAGEIMY